MNRFRSLLCCFGAEQKREDVDGAGVAGTATQTATGGTRGDMPMLPHANGQPASQTTTYSPKVY